MEVRRVLLCAAAALWLVTAGLPAAGQGPEPVTREQLEVLMEEVSNWGRWGPEDELGTLNLVTPEKRKAAAGLVRDGISVSLSHDTLKERGPENPRPLGHTMLIPPRGVFVSDTFEVTFHGYAHSHVDALCHMFHEEKLYNGYPRGTVTETGCGKLGITNMHDGIFSRGVLMDIPRLEGVDYLEPGTAITPDDLEAWEEKAGVRVTSGDVLLLRTGRWARWTEKGPWNVGEGAAGLHPSAAKWLHDRGVAVLGCDGVSDVLPSPVEGVSHPIHQLVLVGMGMPLLDNLDLEALAREAAERERWEFLFVAAPIRVPGATGSPLNPIATF